MNFDEDQNLTPKLAMNKYIQDTIRNNSRCILKGMTLPQKKAVSEIIRGLFTAGTPVLRHLAQDETKTAKKQAEKYARHLANTDLPSAVDEFALRKAKTEIRKNTIIAYDLTDINKDCAKKMERLRRVWDGSKRKTANGYTLHGTGVNNLLLKLEVHNGDKNTQNQIRREIVEKISESFNGKGIWVFDRGNDDKQFFHFLRHILQAQFIARLKENRKVCVKETGALFKVRDLPPGRYTVYLMQRWNTKMDKRYEYTLVISNHSQEKEPIRLLTYLKDGYPDKQIVVIYMKRWGIENIFKRAKTKFRLEKIRVLNHQKFVNLIALIQFAINLSTITFIQIQKLTYSLISGVLSAYRKFIRLKNLTFNLDSYISFLKYSLKPLIIHPQRAPPEKLHLFSRRQVVKLGSF